MAATKTKDQIATIIQKYTRGWLARREYDRLMDEELVFLGMKPAPRPEDPRDDPFSETWPTTSSARCNTPTRLSTSPRTKT